MKRVMISFDIEEFDMPTDYGKTISFQDQIKISAQGTEIILDLLQEHQINATFFSTVVFANQVPHLIRRIAVERHELASHGYFHSGFESQHLLDLFDTLENFNLNPYLCGDTF